MSDYRQKTNLNVLPDAYRRNPLSSKQAMLVLGLVTAIALVILFYLAVSDARSETSQMQDELDILEQRIELNKDAISRKNDMQTTINEYQNITENREYITSDLQIANGIAEEVGITVISVAHGGDTLIAICQAEIVPVWLPSEFSEFLTVFNAYCIALEQEERFSTASHNLPDSYPPSKTGTITIDVTIEIAS